MRAAIMKAVTACSVFMIMSLIFSICNHGTIWEPVGFVIAFIMSWFVVGGLTDIYGAREIVRSVRCYREHEAAGCRDVLQAMLHGKEPQG